MTTEAPTPISIHIPANLRHLTVSLQAFLEAHPKYSNLCVGATIFLPAAANAPSPQCDKLLLVQRAADEAFPNRWEVPGGSSEPEDPTILHSVAREVFEETGLHLTRFVQQIGEGVEFTTGRRGPREHWLKLTFEVEVAEIRTSMASALDHQVLFQAIPSEVEPEPSKVGEEQNVEISLDPKEHQAYKWIDEEDFAASKEPNPSYIFTTEDQQRTILQALRTHNAAVQQLHKNQERLDKMT
ncbi:hypothetical protein MMC20_001780 [Loxospora ochrophaea]|nr:hypothetical protein [Loxospora ochrophaea]